jgi:hypothetical protein
MLGGQVLTQLRNWLLFCEMIGGAAHWAEHRGWKVVLGGSCTFDPNWLHLMGRGGVLGTVSAVGFHGFATLVLMKAQPAGAIESDILCSAQKSSCLLI